MTDIASGEAAPVKQRSLPNRWAYALRTTNPPPGDVDFVTRWIVLTRAAVVPMTITAGIFAGLLVWWNAADANVWLWAVAAVGLVLAHVANNLMNDLFDLEVGTDSGTYPRALYSPHPVLSGMITRKGLAVAALVVNVIDLAIMLYLFTERGWPIIGFAVGGFVLSVAYTAPPLRLKRHGLGEPTVLVVWGPLMVGGVYYAATGTIPAEIVLASIPYALLCTSVLMGKHIDKIPWDERDGTHTLPVILGDRPARIVTQAMLVAFYVLVGVLIVMGTLPILTAVVVLAVPMLVRALRALAHPKPDEVPEGIEMPVWPLWFAAICFVHTRRAGAVLVLGLFAGILLDF